MVATVLGASGFIGRRLVTVLRQQQENVHAPGRDEANDFSKPLGEVYYCIGKTADYGKDPAATFEAHCALLVRLLAQADFERLVLLSSTRLYDGLALGAEDAVLALAPQQSRHLYDLTKALGEHFALLHAQGRGRVARLSCVYDDAPDATGFLPEIFRLLPKQRQLGFNSSSASARDYVHVDDVVAALQAIMKNGKGGVIYNVASGVNVSNAEISQLLKPLGWELNFIDSPPPGAPAPLIAIERLRSLGLKPRTLAQYIDQHIAKVPCPCS